VTKVILRSDELRFDALASVPVVVTTRWKGVAFRRRLRALAERYSGGEITLDEVTASVQGWVNHVRYGNTVGLRTALLSSVPITPTTARPCRSESMIDGCLSNTRAAGYTAPGKRTELRTSAAAQ
jgi:hypothetical protein